MRASCLNLVLVGFVKTALCNEPVDDVRLAQRNDTVALLPRGAISRPASAGASITNHRQRHAGHRERFSCEPDPELDCDPHLHSPDLAYQCNCGDR